MNLFEHQAKDLFREAGIPVPAGRLVSNESPDSFGHDVAVAAQKLGAPENAVAVKSQLLTGGRGKAGLISVTDTPEKAEVFARSLHQGDYHVHTVLVEEAVEIRQELYLAISVDTQAAAALVLASAEGGVEIEELAKTKPEAIKRILVPMERGLQTYHSRGLAFDLGLDKDGVKQFTQVLAGLYSIFRTYDAELLEINPLFLTTAGALVAGDAKVVIDDNSLSRQPRFERTREYYDSDAEFEAAQEGIPYLQFDGTISLMCAGAGLTTTVFDLVNDEGGTVANYLEFGGPNYRKAKRAMELCLQNESEVILVVTFGTIARADVMAEGVVEAIRELKPDRPIVTCIRGTNEEAAVETLRSAGLEPLFDTEEAVRRAVAPAGGGSSNRGGTGKSADAGFGGDEANSRDGSKGGGA